VGGAGIILIVITSHIASMNYIYVNSMRGKCRKNNDETSINIINKAMIGAYREMRNIKLRS
jgi:hypothetical protein